MSEFLKTGIPPSDGREIDFSMAEQLLSTGSSCDVYYTVHRQRRVFVKKLKDTLAYSPEYRAAFAKEYGIGVRLAHHQSLPVYYDYHSEPPIYILMDYIDGDTVARLAESDSDWFKNDSHVRRMLGQLVDVVDFLHQQNVVHCDIKADNVMLTRGTRNVMLIDLGNCYSDWLCFASGNPGNYDLTPDDRGSVRMDYRGIARIVEHLEQTVPGFPMRAFRRFHDLCLDDDVTPDCLHKALQPRDRRWPLWLGAFTAAGIAIILGLNLNKSDNITSSTPTEVAVPDTIVAAPQDSTPTPEVKTEDAPAPVAPPVAAPKAEPEAEPDVVVRDKGYYTEIINAELPPFFAELEKGLDQLELLMRDESLTFGDMLDAIRDFSDEETAAQGRAYSHFHKRFPELDNLGMFLNLIYESDAWAKYMLRSDRVTQAFAAEMRSRARPSSADNAD